MIWPEPSPLPVGPPTPDPKGWSKGELDTLTAVADTFAAATRRVAPGWPPTP